MEEDNKQSLFEKLESYISSLVLDQDVINDIDISSLDEKKQELVKSSIANINFIIEKIFVNISIYKNENVQLELADIASYFRSLLNSVYNIASNIESIDPGLSIILFEDFERIKVILEEINRSMGNFKMGKVVTTESGKTMLRLFKPKNEPNIILPSEVQQGVANAMEIQGQAQVQEQVQIQAGNNINVIGDQPIEGQQQPEVLNEITESIDVIEQSVANKGDIRELQDNIRTLGNILSSYARSSTSRRTNITQSMIQILEEMSARIQTIESDLVSRNDIQNIKDNIKNLRNTLAHYASTLAQHKQGTTEAMMQVLDGLSERITNIENENAVMRQHDLEDIRNTLTTVVNEIGEVRELRQQNLASIETNLDYFSERIGELRQAVLDIADAVIESENRLDEVMQEEQNRNIQLLAAAGVAIGVKGEIPDIIEPFAGSADIPEFIGNFGRGLIPSFSAMAGGNRRQAALIVASGIVSGAYPFIAYMGYQAVSYITYSIMSIDYNAPITKFWEYLGYGKAQVEQQESGNVTITNVDLGQGAIVDIDGNVKYYKLVEGNGGDGSPDESPYENGVVSKTLNWVYTSVAAMVGYLTDIGKNIISYIWNNSGQIASILYTTVKDAINYGTQTTIALIGIGIAAIGLLYNFYKKRQ